MKNQYKSYPMMVSFFIVFVCAQLSHSLDLAEDFRDALDLYKQEQDSIKTVYSEGHKEFHENTNLEDDIDLVVKFNEIFIEDNIWNYQKDGVFFYQQDIRLFAGEGIPHPDKYDSISKYLWNGKYLLNSYRVTEINSSDGFTHDVSQEDRMKSLLRPHRYMEHFTYIYSEEFRNILSHTPEKIRYVKISENNQDFLKVFFTYTDQHVTLSGEAILSYEFDLKPVTIKCFYDNKGTRTISFNDYQNVNDIYFPFSRTSFYENSDGVITSKSELSNTVLEFNTGLKQEFFTPDLKMGDEVENTPITTEYELKQMKEKYGFVLD